MNTTENEIATEEETRKPNRHERSAQIAKFKRVIGKIMIIRNERMQHRQSIAKQHKDYRWWTVK